MRLLDVPLRLLGVVLSVASPTRVYTGHPGLASKSRLERWLARLEDRSDERVRSVMRAQWADYVEREWAEQTAELEAELRDAAPDEAARRRADHLASRETFEAAVVIANANPFPLSEYLG